MKKNKIIGIAVISIVLIGLIVFACTREFEDTHFRVEGIRVRLNGNELVVDGCNEQTSNIVYCERNVKVNNKDEKIIIEFKNFKENGYPNTVVASINGHEFYKKDGLKIEENGSNDYQVFLNFQVIDDYIFFTYTKGSTGRSTTLYAIDTEGNIILEEYKIDDEDMLIKDYTEFITYDDHTIKLYATRVVEDINYKGENVCNANSKDIVEAYYTYTLKNGKFTKKQTETITAAKFIENKGIICAPKK